jgi:predicted HAD superfamily Cof-like phosphohydrolase
MDISEHVDIIREFSKSAGQNAPDSITIPSESEMVLRAKLVLEEALELCDALGVEVVANGQKLTEESLGFSIDSSKNFDMIGVADAAADIFWVGCGGVAALCGFNFGKVLEEVDRSNMSKFIDGYRRDDGKWVKGPSYSPADIASCLEDINKKPYYFMLAEDGLFDKKGFTQFYIVEKSFWNKHKYIDECVEIDMTKYGFQEIMESCFESLEPMSKVDLVNKLVSLGFEEIYGT